ncbi:type II toxin-antitoxin system HicB family antitoxin [Selenomonas sputigena]|mgnify:FL=1|uniref:type II toxin-antitoxin system HicB family antitoxin n=1 Tax=Selenomonas sputigena TaxID=69823 RepID=UPI00222E7306|nr:type II toxin-antitoxin system HicB family antitoxin [Selenomonas sputigena]UZD43008.1 type II toxin-antitoxin system HicB family antitoxin [Selenomonas sputigena]
MKRMKRLYFYPAVFQSEEQGYSVFIPDIPGCMTQGETMEEALAMAQDAIGLMLEDVAPADYPTPSLPQDLPLEKDQFVLMVPFDKLAYDRAYNAKSVKKTLSVPAWLDTLAAEHNVNFSNVLQNALMRELGVSKA